MATEESSSSSVDSYIGSIISLTSKSEIRYEGVLVSINPKESTIALQNVKSYGTEGRIKEGPQIPPSEKVYEYILFRGSDIKDLQVKSTASVPTKQQTHNDPAIIQSHYAYAPTTSNTHVASVGAIAQAHNVPAYEAVHQDISRRQFQDTSSLYQTGSHHSSWTPPPAFANVDGSMHYQGFKDGTSSSQANVPQKSYPFYPQSVSSQNPLQLPKFPENCFPSQPAISDSYNSSPLLSRNTPLAASSVPSHVPAISSLSSSNQELNSMNLISGKASPPSTSFLPISSLAGPSSINTSPPLVTPNQLKNVIPAATSSLHQQYRDKKHMGVISQSSMNIPSTVSGIMPQEPLLPMPMPPQQGECGQQQFSDEFDFTAMNEKFNKDEVWGSLGKDKQQYSTGHGSDDPNRYNAEVNEDNVQDPSNTGSKPVYNKDDFFDTISCNSFNRGGWNGPNRMHERRKLDTETFGEYQEMSHMGRGNYGGSHSGYYRGSYNRGRGYGYYGGRGGRGGYRPSY